MFGKVHCNNFVEKPQGGLFPRVHPATRVGCLVSQHHLAGLRLKAKRRELWLSAFCVKRWVGEFRNWQTSSPNATLFGIVSKRASLEGPAGKRFSDSATNSVCPKPNATPAESALSG
jgi:hypothetical protein